MPVQPARHNARRDEKRTGPIGRFLARFLDPIDLIVEGIYSVLIVLTFTLAVNAADSNELLSEAFGVNLVTQLFWAALGCAVAWGLIDGAMYVLTCVFERGKERRLFRAVHGAATEEEGVATLAGELDDELGSLASEEERKAIYLALYERLRVSPPPPPGFEREDLLGALGVAMVAICTALPVVLPLLLVPDNPNLAVRLSNLTAFAMLFIMGHRWAVYAGGRPWLFGTLLMLLGIAMVLIAIPLGG
jgi:hypothetical protein